MINSIFNKHILARSFFNYYDIFIIALNYRAISWIYTI